MQWAKERLRWIKENKPSYWNSQFETDVRLFQYTVEGMSNALHYQLAAN